ncbi:MAG TPA: hypothetical protein PLN96_01825 [Zoogloea sp.]|nr:hypothetical protein [Zoogloea sp.]HMV16403.1 hypothetical protein [Rhodocyclaceae bacterium]HMV61767.1 hypothetical protein [Rhodocyclaceae bacterium]HMW51141.1 hypothetical protein [Rhodocyclaceae bacterium]HMY48390.1 hypothetical protein [Rhodocyclaceae bacterium]HMZ75577.1 hypothetical protein [Rhodocyclaceae bacterium]
MIFVAPSRQPGAFSTRPMSLLGVAALLATGLAGSLGSLFLVLHFYAS